MINFEEGLTEEDMLTVSEAAYRWGVKRNTLVAALNRGRFDRHLESGEVRKFTLHGATEWYVSVKAMRAVFGTEEKVQIYELWNEVGDKRPPKRSLNFRGKHIKVFGRDEVISDELIEALNMVETYEEAYKIVTGIDIR